MDVIHEHSYIHFTAQMSNVIPMDMIYHLDDTQGISVTMMNKPFHPKSIFKVNDGCQTLGHKTFGHLSITFCSHLLECA